MSVGCLRSDGQPIFPWIVAEAGAILGNMWNRFEALVAEVLADCSCWKFKPKLKSEASLKKDWWKTTGSKLSNKYCQKEMMSISWVEHPSQHHGPPSNSSVNWNPMRLSGGSFAASDVPEQERHRSWRSWYLRCLTRERQIPQKQNAQHWHYVHWYAMILKWLSYIQI